MVNCRTKRRGGYRRARAAETAFSPCLWRAPKAPKVPTETSSNVTSRTERKRCRFPVRRRSSRVCDRSRSQSAPRATRRVSFPTWASGRVRPESGAPLVSKRARREPRSRRRGPAAAPSSRSPVASDRALRSIDPIPVGSRPVPAKGRPARKARRRATRASPRAFPTRAGSRFRGTRESPRESACTRGTRRRSRAPRATRSSRRDYKVCAVCAVPSTRRWCTPRADR